jgi:hypothetical protein
MFQLLDQRIKITNVNPRTEKHGEENKLACDIAINVTLSNEVLYDFEGGLKYALYKKDEENPDLLDSPTLLTKLKFPLLGAIKWAAELQLQTLIVDFGIGGISDIKLTECKVNKFVFNCQEGGSVEINFRVQAHPDQDQIGKLCTLIQQEVNITLRPSTGEEQLVTPEQKQARADAESLFHSSAEQLNQVMESMLQGSEQAESDVTFEEVEKYIAKETKVSVKSIMRDLKTTSLQASSIIADLIENGRIMEPNAQGVHLVVLD